MKSKQMCLLKFNRTLSDTPYGLSDCVRRISNDAFSDKQTNPTDSNGRKSLPLPARRQSVLLLDFLDSLDYP